MTKEQATFAGGFFPFARDGWVVPRFFMALAVLAVACGSGGCACHYANPLTGAEHLWGFGQLQLQTNSVSADANWAAVSSGVRVPGLCVSLGRDQFGFTLGYLNQQRLTVVSSDQFPELIPPKQSWFVSKGRNANAHWAFGYLQMRTAGSAHRRWAFITGKALAGIGARAGPGGTSLGFAFDSRQVAVVQQENVQLEFEQAAPRWPGFDLFAARVQVVKRNNIESIQQAGEP